MTKPINPNVVQEAKNSTIPDAIIEATNELIIEKWNGSSSTIKQKDIVSLACSKDSKLTSDIIFSNNWMDIEDIFRKVGWKVSYDKPGFNESYDATFDFKK